MNKIFKVIYSKVRNCYVVTSEFAKANTKSSTGSAKQTAKKSLLSLAIAMGIACGGFVNVGAAVDVSDVNGVPSEVYTTKEVDIKLDGKANKATTLADYGIADAYTKGEVDKALATNTTNITTNKENISKLEGKLTNLATAVNGKADAAYVNTELAKKADTTAVNALAGRVGGVEGKVTALDLKIGVLQNKAKNLDSDGTALTGMTTVSGATVSGTNVEADTLKVTGEIIDGKGVTTTLATIDASMKQTNTNKADIANLKTTTGEQDTAIKDLQKKSTNISYADGAGTSIDGIIVKDGNIVGNGNSAITGITNIATDSINGKSLAGTTVATVKEVTDAVGTEKTERENADKALSDRIGNLTEGKNYIKKDKNVSDNLVELDKQAKTNADNIKNNKDEIARVNGELVKTNDYFNTELGKTNNHFNTELGKTNAALQATNKRTAGIERTDTGVAADTQTVIEGKVHFDQNGNVSGVKDLKTDTIHATGEITSEGLDARAGAIKTTGKVSAGDVFTGTLETTGNAKIGGDLTVNGKLNVGEIYMEHHKQESTGEEYDSATAITADGISNRAKVTDENGNTTESKFTHNEKGTFNYAKDGKITGEWKGSTSNVTADGVSNKMTDSDGNRHTYSQTATESKEQLVNGDKSNFEKKTAEGNTVSIKDKGADKSLTNQQTVDGEKTSVTNKDSSSTIKQEADQIRYNVTSDEKKSSIEVKADGITNTSKDGTIINDAKDIVNNATGDMTNTVGGKLTTTVKDKATENFNGGLDTTVTGAENHTVTGKQTNTVKGGQENIISGGQTNTITGGQTNTITGGQINNITGDQITNVSGTQTTTATDINRNASSGMIDTVDNAYGTNKETKVAGKTTTEVSIKGTEEKAEYIRGANEAKDELSKGTLKNSETKTVGATSTEITDGTNTSATIQDKTQISGSVTHGTSSAVSNVKADSIDTAVKEGANTSLISQKKNSITSAVGNGTTSTVIQQGDKDITIASNGGTVGIAGKDIINNATYEITNTAGTKITDQVGTNTRVLDNEGITDTVGNTSFKQRIDDIMMEAKNGTIASDAKNITNKATEKISNEAAEIANKASGTISNDAAEIKNTAGKLISNKVGENTYQNIENGKITESIKNGIKQNLTQSDADKTEHSVVNGENVTVNKQTSEELTGAVTNGSSSNVIQNTAISSNNTIANLDAAGKPTKANSVISTVDGTTFSNTEANTVLTAKKDLGKDFTNTTIKGNTITTGQATMDYAEVMKDLGVHGNAKIDGKTTTGSLEVKGESKLTGNVTMESNATVEKNLTVNGTTKLKNTKVDGTLDVTQKATFRDDVDIKKNLSVDGNATIVGDVTANSYKVGDKTYISAAGINANDQKITNVADGSISEGSKDAVNGGQLFETNRRIDQFDSRINEVGANAAAMANLHPMEFDADSKLNVAVGVGNYRNKTATAMGLFYRPNEDVMFNVSSTIGSNDNMVGGGISFRLGSGGNKEKTKALAQAAEQNKQLKSQVDTLQAQMDALLSVINPNMSKDFPDVPNNHWAYEAVSRLAGNDIIQGYEDGKYHGERTMTRYEMAVIIYKALQKGAKAEAKLVEEFKPELKAIAAHEKA